jgi:hypothetical protein
MNMRRAWTLPLLSALAVALMARPSWAQGGTTADGGAPPGYPQPSAAGIPLAMMPAGYAPQAAPPGGYYMPAGPAYSPYAMAPAAYTGGPIAADGAIAPQMPAQFPVGHAPDVYGAYGYVPTNGGAPGYGPPDYGQGGYGPIAYGQGGGQPMGPGYDPSYGMSGGPMPGGPMGGPAYGGPGTDGCQFCGGYGCDNCRGGIFGHHRGYQGGHGSWLPNGLLGDVLGLVAPYPDGGCAAVRWFDFAVDYMMLKRDNTGRSDQAFTSLGIAGPTVLSANDLDFGSYEPGFRFTGAFQVGSANSVEFTYFGQFHYDARATARAPGALFSVYSDFGLVPFGGFAEFDMADFQQIDYTSSIDSFEVNWRNRWMAPNCRYQGSWTVGVRHFILDEKLRYATSSYANGIVSGIGVIPARSQSDTDVTNNLTGIQFGTDLWVCVLPGLRAGGEVQAGVYGNHMNINTTIGSNLLPDVNEFRERQESNDVAFIGQINLLTTYRINYQWTVRAGYQFLYVEGVALAPENFNPQPPFLNNPFDPRVSFVNDNGNVFYHGWNVGLEFMW